MAYIDFSMRPPREDVAEPAVPPGPAPALPRASRPGKSHASYWIAGGIAALFPGLVFALVFASIGEPFIAALVTIVLLLPCAGLIGGDGRRRP